MHISSFPEYPGHKINLTKILFPLYLLKNSQVSAEEGIDLYFILECLHSSF
jgi:hypothetical protein